MRVSNKPRTIATGTPWDTQISNPPAEPARAGRWLAADEWMSDFLRRVSEPRSRRRRAALTERLERPWDYAIRAAAAYDEETDEYVKYLRHESRNHDGAIPLPT